MPILIYRRVHLRETDGKIVLDCDVTLGMIKIDFGNVGIFDEKKQEVFGMFVES